MTAVFIYLAIALIGSLAGLAVSVYSGYRVALGPEEDENDSGEVRKTYKWRLDSAETCIIPLSAFLWVLLFYVIVGDRQGAGDFSNVKLMIKWLTFSLSSSVLAGVAFVDWKIFEIPPLFDILTAVFGAARLLSDLGKWEEYLIGSVLVSGIFLLIALASKGRAMGGGDIKLTAAMGLLLGWKQILLVMTLGSLLGAVIHSVLMKVSRKEHMLAFGPYLAVAGITSMLVGDKIVEWYTVYMISTISV